MINQGYKKILGQRMVSQQGTMAFKTLARTITFLSVVIAWVFFRASDFPTALRVLSSLVPIVTDSGWPSDIQTIFWNQGLETLRGEYWLLVLATLVFLTPNSNQIGELALNRCRSQSSLSPLLFGAALITCIFLILVNSTRDSASAFIYFNF